MGTTVTARGITPHFMIMGLATGQLYLLPRRLVDPRRSEKKPTAAQARYVIQHTHMKRTLVVKKDDVIARVFRNTSLKFHCTMQFKR